jgi:selenocysteine-specific elongation factor
VLHSGKYNLHMFVIGTAGHVDHGKSALVQALTGMDPDRLREEKDRGMTIDLGFAWLKLPGGAEVSLVDVPGHERFIKNMLAGVGGIDLALLIIAADEGVMPQTREHLAILDLLGVQRGVLVVTKSDLVDADWLDLVAAEVEEVVKGTTLEGSPLVRCSAVTGDGLEQLLGVIEYRLGETQPKRDLGRPRLPIDRVFTVAGFGTVVTGTLVDGVFSLGQEVEVVPAIEGGHLTSLRSRVRGLQTHRSGVEQAQPGTRTAANLAGIDPDQLWRGQVVTTPGWMKPSEAVDVRLRALESLKRPLRHNLNVTFHSLAAEAPARLRLLEDDELLPGDEGWAQMRLFRPLAVLRGDRFIIRDANDTLGGGTIVETQARRHPRRRETVLSQLERLQADDPAEGVFAAVAGAESVEVRGLFSRLDIDSKSAEEALGRLADGGRIVVLGSGRERFVYTATGFERLRLRANAAIETHLKAHPLRQGMRQEELRSRLELAPRVFGLVLEEFVERGELEEHGSVVAPSGWAPHLSDAQAAQVNGYLAALKADPFSPPTDRRPHEQLVAYLVDAGQVVDAGSGVVFAREAFDEMTRVVVASLRQKGRITMGEVRDLLGSSRRYMQPFLEELDRRHVTMRRGDERLLRSDPGADNG